MEARRTVPWSSERSCGSTRPLAPHERDAVAHAGLEARVGDLLEPEGLAVEVRGLGGVADPELDVVDAVERHEVLAGRVRRHNGLRAHGSSSMSMVSRFMIALSCPAAQARNVAHA